mmetsp:Transcript_15710/g.43407  ORF Transcript_15710/g.43407 Transcript_15710/m.43407 type:complete len:86 (+) Transcript_15710:546-803(+)
MDDCIIPFHSSHPRVLRCSAILRMITFIRLHRVKDLLCECGAATMQQQHARSRKDLPDSALLDATIQVPQELRVAHAERPHLEVP